MLNIKYCIQLVSNFGLIDTVQILHNSVYIVHNNLQKRYIFGFHGKKKEFYDRKLVGYSCEQMFDIVADVKNYKNFLPFCTKSLIVSERSDYLEAALQIGFPPIVESYTSKVSLVKPFLVKAICKDGKLFNYLVTTWKFSQGLRSNPQSCIIDFSIDFEFKSVFHSNLAHMFFDKLVLQMEDAFLIEAKNRYGRESLPSHPLPVRRS